MRRFVAGVLCIVLYSSTYAGAQNSALVAAAAAGQARTSAVKNSFQEVTSHLDSGGNLFVYLSTEEWLKGLSGEINKWRDMVVSLPDMTANDKQSAAMVFDIVSRLVRNSGAEQVSGYGLSSIQIEKDLYRVASMLHHYRGEDSGYLWSVMGKKSHALDGLDLMPSNTALAAYSDLDLPLVWSAINDEVNKSGVPGAREAMASFPAQFQTMTGADLNQVLSSLGGEYGLVVTLDETNMMPIPLPVPGPPMQIPEFGVMVMLKVKNDALFNLLEERINDTGLSLVKADRGSVRMRTLDLPAGMLPPFLRPTLARSGDYLFIATSDTLVESALAVKAGGRPGLKSTEEFRKYSQGIAPQGNSFSFISPKVGKLVAALQTQVLDLSAPDPGEREAAAKVMSALGGSGGSGSYAVSANTEEGWVATANMTQNPASMMLAPLAVVPLIAAIAIPNLERSRAAANESAAIINLKNIVSAEVAHLVMKNEYGNLQALIANSLIDSRFGSTVSGYKFEITVSGMTFLATARPESSNTGRYGYYVTEDGVVRYSLDASQAPAGQSGRPVR